MINWREVPKADFHVHFEGTKTPNPFPESIILPSGKTLSPDSSDLFAKFALSFLDNVKNLDFEREAQNLLKHAIEHSVLYAELYISPSSHYAIGRSQSELIEGTLKAQDIFESGGLKYSWIFDIVRGAPDSAQRTLDTFENARSKGIRATSLGLAGDERAEHASSYQQHLTGLDSIVVHSGESLKSNELEFVINELSPNRIAHALPLASSKELQDLVNKKNIWIELCPCSNLALIEELNDCSVHLEIIERCPKVLICSDDPGILGLSLSDNYRLLENAGVNGDKLVSLAKQSLAKAGLNP